MIIGNNFQRLYCPCTHTITQIIFIINGHSISIEKLSKAYTHKKIEFTRSQRGEKVTLAQQEIALTISLLELSIKERIVEQQEKLYKELYSNNPLKFWDKDKIFAKISPLIPTLLSESNKSCTHTRIFKNLINKAKNFWIKD